MLSESSVSSRDLFVQMMLAQFDLQRGAMNNNPFDMAQRAIMIRRQELSVERVEANYFAWWNAYACERELGEAMDEVAWKPWATSQHFNAVRYIEEMVDAWHFFMNMLLVAIPLVEYELEIPVPLDEPEYERIKGFCQYFVKKYYEKHEKNAQRQRDGYDGVSTKCIICHRDFEEVEDSQTWAEHGVCSQPCYVDKVHNSNAEKIRELDREKQERRRLK